MTKINSAADKQNNGANTNNTNNNNNNINNGSNAIVTKRKVLS